MTEPTTEPDDKLAEHPRRLRAIMFVDVVEYARLMSVDEDGTSERIANLIEQCESIAFSRNGELVQTRGDGLYFLFDSVVDAVFVANTIQKTTEQDNHCLPDDQRIRLRVGVHMGDVIQVKNQYVGDSVNIASRIESMASAGTVCISASVYEQVKQKLNLGFEYMGCVELKNIPDPVDIYRISNDTRVALLSASPRTRVRESTVMPSGTEFGNKPTIAVLPFANLDRSDRDDFFADGVTEDLITNLSRFHSLAVISRSSTFMYKNREIDLKQVGEELRVKYVVTGSIRWSSKQLRLTAELFNCHEGIPLWRERYQRELDDIFELQDEITDLISSAVAVQAESADNTRGQIQVPALISTYSLMLKGQQKVFRYSREQNVQARHLYEAALENESDYGRAMAAISRTHNLDWRYSWTDQPEYALERAFELAQESVVSDPGDARGYGELAFVNLYRKDHDASLAAFETALRLNPNDTDIMSNMGDALAHWGRSEEAIKLLNRALLLNPFYPDQYLWYLGGAQFNLKQYDEAVKTLKRMNSPAEGRRLLAACYAYMGKKDEAKYQASKVMEAYPNFNLAHWEKVQPDVNPEDTQHFVDGLILAGLK
ncbi:adenylate/guanylate cyclase domain-containing protein [bacterium]|nr:adenylate/guanylate cyclase domain-containing protein [bacterium]MDC0434613.1 adenylate/guanylate cyclase domain-containing protein [bacterium]